MIIKFEKPIYETIWTGDVDQILECDTEHYTFLVMDVKTRIKRKHMTSLDTRYLSTGNVPHKPENRKETLQYIIDLGLPKYMISDRIGLLKGMKKTKKTKVA